jgi:hypothetical protein
MLNVLYFYIGTSRNMCAVLHDFTVIIIVIIVFLYFVVIRVLYFFLL